MAGIPIPDLNLNGGQSAATATGTSTAGATTTFGSITSGSSGSFWFIIGGVALFAAYLFSRKR